ncbi:MAG: NERD domain-containing protein [Clostridiales bacterium]|nr:NERD domain-containing protein [Clostridiales bacterium]
MEFLIILFIISILYVIFLPQIKGYFGERVVATMLSGLPIDQYKILNNIMLRTEYGTTQIDHIVVSVYGIFVIETKNYKGWITGNEYADQWTKNMYGKKYRFRNPLKQNYAHVKALVATLDIPEDKFIPIVVFSINSDIKVKTSKPVVYTGQLGRTIKSYSDIKFTEHELDGIVTKIRLANVTNKDAKKEHVNQIRTKVRDNNLKIAQGVCPKCGGRLVQRRGRYGVFTGCSNYPKCRYTNNK